MVRSLEAVEIMLPVTVVAKFCRNCPEMKLEHRADLCIHDGHLDVKQNIVCGNLYKCQHIFQAAGLKKEEAHEQDT